MNFYKDVAPTAETKDGDKIYVPDALKYAQAIPDLVDNGSKNLLDLGNCTFESSDGLSYKVSNLNEITVSTTSSSSSARSILINNINLPVNTKLVLSGCPENGSGTSYMMYVNVDGSPVDGSIDAGTGSTGFILNPDQTACIRIRIAANYTMSNKVFKVMVCKKEAWDVSHEFVPYKYPIGRVFYEKKKAGTCPTTYGYTGVSFTVPAGIGVRITVMGWYSQSQPREIGLCMTINSTSYNICYGSYRPETATISVTATALLEAASTARTVSVYGAWANGGSNDIVIIMERFA